MGAETGWEFCLLGPLAARYSGREVPLGGVKPRSLLAMLLLDVGRVVSTGALIRGLWGDEPPPTAASALQVHVANLRKAFAGASGVDTSDAPLRTESSGYVLKVDPASSDLHRFRSTMRAARLSGAADGRTRADVAAALELWRGEPLAGLEDQPFAPATITYLEEERLSALDWRIDADLAAGAHAQLVGELGELCREHPLRESFTRQLMVALYRCGRHADALTTFSRLRAHLGDELGLDPSPELRQLENDVLRHAPHLSWPPPGGAPSPSSAVATVVRGAGSANRVGVLRWHGGEVVLSERTGIGRDLDNAFTIDDPEMSRHHALIRRTTAGFLLTDLHSTNGTLVNGEPQTEWLLQDGDVVRLGTTELTFALRD